MPSGPPELHAKWCALDPHGCGDLAAQRFLQERGYRLLMPQWAWAPPADHTPTEEEREAAFYLVAEWDFGGITGGRS